MKKVLLITLSLVLVLGLMAGCQSAGTSEDPQVSSSSGTSADTSADTSDDNNSDLVFSLITMDSIDQFWLSVQKGADSKAQEFGVTLRFDAPVGKTDPQAQSDMVLNAISNGVDGILISPTNMEALAPAIDKAKEAGIPVVYVGTTASSENYIASFTTDNYAAGGKAAEEMGKIIGGKGQVAVIYAQQGDDSGMQRGNGFIDKMKEMYPDVEIVAELYSDGLAEKAMNQTADLLSAYTDIVGIFAINEGSTIGVSQALVQAEAVEKVTCIGFDLSDNTRTSIKEGTIEGAMVQAPIEMGEKGVETLWNYIVNNVTPDPRDIFTGNTFVTIDNVDEN